MMSKSTSRNAATNHASQIKNHGSMNKAIRVGVIGLGTVGQGVLRLLKNNAAEIARRVGRPLTVTHVSVRDASKSRDCDLSGRSEERRVGKEGVSTGRSGWWREK